MPDAPGTPPAPSTSWQGLHPGLLALHRLECLVLTGVPAVGVALALALTGQAPWAVAALASGVVVLLLSRWLVARRFFAWSWAEREDDLLLRRGLLVRRTTVVPYGRMQYVDVTAGPLDRRFGVASVVLHTAAVSTHASIPGLGSAEAARLRDRLAALGEARAAGV